MHACTHTHNQQKKGTVPLSSSSSHSLPHHSGGKCSEECELSPSCDGTKATVSEPDRWWEKREKDVKEEKRRGEGEEGFGVSF